MMMLQSLTRNKISIIVITVVAVLIGTYFLSQQTDEIDYSLQVKPILNKRCIACHGGVRKKGGFSLLFREEALDTTESGKLAVVPGHPEQSEMIRRLALHDPEERMPFKHDPLPE